MVVKVVDQTTGEHLKPIIRNYVRTDATICTDGHGAYKNLDREFKDHGIVQHDRDEYVRGIYHTNTMEGFWSQFKRGIIGVYHHVSPQHLQRYADEFSFRYNSRKITDKDSLTY